MRTDISHSICNQSARSRGNRWLSLSLVLSSCLWPAASAFAALRIWDGGGNNDFWTVATNWVDDVAPVPGDDLEFLPGAMRPVNTNNFPAGTMFNSIRISGINYFLYGSNILLNAGINASGTTVNNTFRIPVTLNSNQTITTGNAGVNLYLNNATIDTGGKDLTFAGNGLAQVQSPISGAGGLIKTGIGSLLLYASNTFSGPVQILQGGISLYHGNALGTTNGSTTVSTNGQLSLVNSSTVPEPLVLGGLLGSFGSGSNTLNGPVTLSSSNVTISVTLGAPLTINGIISGDFGFTKTSLDVLTLTGFNTYTGTNIVNGGTLMINAPQYETPVILNNGILGGKGNIQSITCSGVSPKTVSPGGGETRTFSAKRVSFNPTTTLAIQLDGTAPGKWDQLRVEQGIFEGAVNLGNAVLSLTLGFMPAVGNKFVIMDLTTSHTVVGTFSGLPEGKIFTNSGAVFMISYAGGTGNDVVLYRVNPPAQFTSISRLTNDSVQLQGAGLSTLTYTMQAASNLNPVIQWSNIGTALANAGGQFSFIDTNAPSFPMRFYRALSP